MAAGAMLTGRLGEAREHLARCDEEPSAGRGLPGDHAHVVLEARLVAEQEGAEPALALLADVYDDLSAHARVLLDDPEAAAWLVRTALAAGDRHRAEAAAARAGQLAADNRGYSAVAAAADHAFGLLEADAAALERAAQGHRHPWARACAWEDAGAAQAEGGDRAAACSSLERALAAYDQIGAELCAARVRGRLRRLGVRRRRCRHAERPGSGWASLTDAERRVAQLVGEGLTNATVGERLFLSRHTVDFHLRHVFRKLGIDSRVELARIVARAGGRGDDDVNGVAREQQGR
jgi:DNA-binding CsgD family transcriptional regulator